MTQFLQRCSYHPALTTCCTVILLAVLSTLSNISTSQQLSGQDDLIWFLRLVLSKALNAGTIWAAIGIWVGWLFTKPLKGVVAAIPAAEFTLIIHYALGQLIGIYTPGIWGENSHWFFMGIVAIAPLALVGVLTHYTTTAGLIARLVLPLGALAEPFVAGFFTNPAGFNFPWPPLAANRVVGTLLVVTGLIGCFYVIRTYLRNKKTVRTAP